MMGTQLIVGDPEYPRAWLMIGERRPANGVAIQRRDARGGHHRLEAT